MAGWCNGNIQDSASCTAGSIPAPASIFVSRETVRRLSMCLKRSCAVLATLLVIFSVSLVPAYGDTPAAAVDSPLFLYVNFPTADPLLVSSAYPVPWNKYEIGYAWNLSESYADTRLGVTSSQFKALSSSGSQPTIYYAYCVAVGSGVSAPAYISGVSKTISGTAYNINGGVIGSITQTLVAQMAGGGDHRKVAVCRTTLPHNTIQFEIPVLADSPGFRLYQGTNSLGFAFAYVVNTDNTEILSYLDQIVHHLANMDVDLDTVIQILRSCVDYLNKISVNTDNIAKDVAGIYDLLKNALADESAVVSQESKKVGDQIMMQTDGETYWKDKNTENFNALDIGNFSFGSSLLSGLQVVGNWFSILWEALGPVTIIFTFPLILGIALVVVGRVSRAAGKGSKSGKGGGDDG